MKKFVWTDFYSEFATSLLKYAPDRTKLIEMIKEIYTNAKMKLPTLERDNNIVDIDPFTIFALFNKGITNENRYAILTQVKDLFKISADVPNDFDGIPVANNLSATFYHFNGGREENDIENLWNLFRYAIIYADQQTNEAEFINAFNKVVSQKGVSWNITMGLYWIRPYTFINLDARNRKLLENNQSRFKPDIDIMKTLKRMVSAEKYLILMKKTKEIMSEYNSFPELSFEAWKMSTEHKDAFFGDNSKWWPSLAEYNPNLSKEDWKKYLLEIEIPNHPSPMQMLKAMLELGGEASCKQLSDKYGGHPSVYVGCTASLGRRVKKYFNLPPCMDGEQERYFPNPFLGKKINEDGVNNYCYKIRPELYEALQEIDLSNISVKYTEDEDVIKNTLDTDIKKNTILFGPPGTGKTYHTVVYAVAIIENKSLADVKAESYTDVLARYNAYKENGQIEFTTFHQSYGYEEFIEGIKPVMDNADESATDIRYSIEDGLFKAFCNKAGSPVIKQQKFDVGLNNEPTIWKVSLEGTGNNPTRRECLDNNHIRIGYDHCGEDASQIIDTQEYGYSVLNRFINEMTIGDIVISCYTASTIDAIGVVTSECEWHPEYDSFKRLRTVKWLVKDIREDIVSINNGKRLANPAVHRVNISLNDIMDIVKKLAPNTIETEKKSNHVFIIDEINRGNISKIFGELITLIEPTKRTGQAEGMKVKLPYSAKPFGVPDNVYILGTMNTADRSIAMLDTALRRRFRFKEIMPNPDILNGINIEGISISDMLTRINKRISVLYDREHTIGLMSLS